MTADEALRQINRETTSVSGPEAFRLTQAILRQIEDTHERQLAEHAIELGYTMGAKILPPSTVVIFLHGIRTHAEWYERLAHTIRESGRIRVYPVRYGYFTALGFWLPGWPRRCPLHTALREVREVFRQHRTSRVKIVAHSFGTYLTTRMLSTAPDIEFDQVIMSGAVVKECFDWTKVPNYPKNGVLNDCGTRDFMPVLASAVGIGYGAAGTFGFHSPKLTQRFHDCGHSDFFDDEFMNRFWVPALVNDEFRDPPRSTKRRTPPRYWSLIAKVPGGPLLLAAIVGGAVYLLFRVLVLG